MNTLCKRLAALSLSTSMAAALAGCGGSSTTSAGSAADTSESSSETVSITVGYQTPCAQTWGALIMEQKNFLKEELESEFQGVNFEISWEDYTSGPPMTNNMIAGKLQFAFMGDLPILVNGEKGEKEQNYDSVFLALDGKGDNGANQALFIPADSPVTSVEELAGKEVGVVLGSSAHRMLELILEQHGLLDDVTLVNQDVSVGLTNIEQNKVAAYAAWEPYPTLAETNGAGKILVDGSETGVDYLDGVVADRTWVEENTEYTVAFLRALEKAHQFIAENPDEAARVFAEATGYDLEVTKVMVENITFESVFTDEDIKTIQGDLDFAISVGNVSSLDLNHFIDDSYLKEAYSDLGIEYPD